MLPAAGAGSRFGGSTPKPLADVGGRPMIVHVLEALVREAPDMPTIVVTRSEHHKLFDEALRPITTRVSLVSDDSFGGSAGAVLTALQTVETEEILVVWPDHLGVQFLPPTIVTRRISEERSGYLPVVHRQDPYAAVEVSDCADLLGFVPPELVRENGLREAPSDCGLFALRAEICERFIRCDHAFGTRDHNLVSVLAAQQGDERLEVVWVDDWRASLGINSVEDAVTFLEASKRSESARYE